MADKSKDPTYAKKHPLLRWCAPTAAPVAPISAFLLDIKRPDGTALKADELAAIVKRLKRQPAPRHVRGGDGARDLVKLREQQAKVARLLPDPRDARDDGRQGAAQAVGLALAGYHAQDEVLLDEGRGSLLAARCGRDVGGRAARDDAANETTPAVEFAAARYAIIEAAGTVTLRVRRRGPLDGTASVAYATKDGTAVAVEDYVAKTGTLTFAPGEDTAEIVIEIIDDDIEEDDEYFTVELSYPTGGLALGAVSTSTVTIINDDFPGVFSFPVEEVRVAENEKEVTLKVARLNGCSGAVSCRYTTVEGSALPARDFIPAEGVLEWAAWRRVRAGDFGAADRQQPFERKEFFEVKIAAATGGAKFDETTDGSTRCASRA